MAFTPQNLDGQAAVKRALARKTYASGMCLGFVDAMFQKPQSNRPGYYDWAIHSYYDARDSKRLYQGTPPRGAVVYLSAGSNGRGHICISTGGGNVVSTDTPSAGRVGVTSIEALCRRWGRRYLGWSDRLMGHNVVNLPGVGTSKPPAPVSESAPSTPPKGSDELMAIPIAISRIADPVTKKPSRTKRVIGPKGSVKIESTKHEELIRRVAKGDDNILQSEVVLVVEKYFRPIF